MLIQDQFGIIQNLQISPIPQTSFLVGTFIHRFLQQTGSRQVILIWCLYIFNSNSLNHTGLRNQNLQNCVQPDSTASDENKSSSKNSRNNNARAQELLHKHHHSVKKMQTPSVSRRNARERNRVKQVNNGFSTLRTHIPHLKNKTSKVDTLRAAVDYIRALRNLMGEPINMEHLHQGPVLITELEEQKM